MTNDGSISEIQNALLLSKGQRDVDYTPEEVLLILQITNAQEDKLSPEYFQQTFRIVPNLMDYQTADLIAFARYIVALPEHASQINQVI